MSDSIQLKIMTSQRDRTVQFGRELWRSSGSTPLLEQGQEFLLRRESNLVVQGFFFFKILKEYINKTLKTCGHVELKVLFIWNILMYAYKIIWKVRFVHALPQCIPKNPQTHTHHTRTVTYVN